MNLTSFLPLLAELLIKSAAILLAAALVDQTWRRASAAQRHAIWLAAFVALLFLPATRLVAPYWNLAPTARAEVRIHTISESAKAPEAEVETFATATAPVSAFWPDWPTVGVGLWLTGAAVLLGRRALGSMRLRLMLRASVAADDSQLDRARQVAGEFGVRRPIALRVSRTCRVPLTWGTRRPVLMLPADCATWSCDRLLAALRHELAHIRRGDYAVRLLADVVRALYWPNPLAWFASRAIRTTQEQACDDLVLNAGTCPTDYATLLCEAARRFSAPHCAVAMAQPSTLESRVRAIVDPTRDRRPLNHRTAIIGAVAIACTLFACTATQVRPVESASTPKMGKFQGPQVMIEAKFVEITPGTKDGDGLLASLGLAPEPVRKPTGGIRFLTDTGFRELSEKFIGKALHEKKGVAVLSTPGAITKSQQHVKIEIVREFDYPTSWKKDAASGHWRVTARAKKNTGVTLDAEPVVHADGKIALEIKPQVVEFLGFKDLDTGKFPVLPGPIAVTGGEWMDDHKRLAPLFSERTLDTNVVLQNGGTVVLGGFRQAGSSKPRAGGKPASELLVFVTATIVKPDGRR